MRAAEVLEVLSTRGDHRVVGRTRRRRDCYGAPEQCFGIVQTSCLLRDDAEVVQGVGQIRVQRTQFGFLKPGGLPQQLFRRDEIAGARGALSVPEHVLNVARFRHRIPGAAAQSDSDTEAL
jgi:hypothetical protein